MNLFAIKLCLYKFQEYCQLVPNEVCNDIVKEYPSLTIANECQYIPRQTCSEDDMKSKEIIKPVIKKVILFNFNCCPQISIKKNILWFFRYAHPLILTIFQMLKRRNWHVRMIAPIRIKVTILFITCQQPILNSRSKHQFFPKLFSACSKIEIKMPL